MKMYINFVIKSNKLPDQRFTFRSFYQNCLYGSDWLHKKVTGSKIGFKMQFSKLLLSKTTRPELSFLVYNIIKIMPLGSKLTPPGRRNFTLIYIRKPSNDFPWTANGTLTKLNRNDTSVVSYQNCLNRSDWLHK